ncbi:MAG: flavin reductase family protein [Balneolaceae bacterium]
MNKETFKSIDPKSLSIADRQGLLSSAVAPRPICFASTVDKNGKVNLSPFSFFNVFSSNPPIMIFSPARRGRDGTVKHTYENVLEVPEVCINIVNYAMVEQMSLASTEYEKGVNEFVKAGFTEITSETITPPRVAESPVSFECTVDDVIELGNEGGAGNLVLSRVQRIHINTDFLTEEGSLDTTKLDLVARLGGNWYSRTTKDSLFEIPKPIRTKGIGIDSLPATIRNSNILSANNLGRLGNVEQLPSTNEIEAAQKQYNILELTQAFEGDIKSRKVHELAKSVLEEGYTEHALAILLSELL